MASSLSASQSTLLKNPNFLTTVNSNPKFLSLPKTLTFPRNKFTLTASLNPILSTKSVDPIQPLLTGSTRTLTTLLATTLTASKVFANKFVGLGLHLEGFHGLQQALVCSAGPALFAAAKIQPVGALNTPLTVVAAGLAKWLDIYSGVLMVRVLLSWFPNIPWERQPLSAIRDLCDPYLNLFRNIIPPIFNALDVSPLLAFAVLGTLGSILNSSRG